MVYLRSIFTTTAVLLACASALMVSPPFDPENIDDADVVPSIDVPSMSKFRRGNKKPGLGGGKDVDELGLYVCTDKNYQGDCYSLKTTKYKCVNFDESINNKITSVTTDENVLCSLYQEENCKGIQFPTTSNGRPDLDSLRIDNTLTSYKCWRYTAV